MSADAPISPVSRAQGLAAIAELRELVYGLEPIYPGDLEALAADAADRGDYRLVAAAHVALAWFATIDEMECSALNVTERVPVSRGHGINE